jgi:putative pyruvate formate lyase activating enzyme
MLSLQRHGCHNINFVTPEHIVPQVLEALLIAVDQGLRLPLVYNTSGYDSLQSLALLDGVVDIYMPDLKLFSPSLSKKYLKAEDYPEGHLVMPGLPEESRSILEWIATELGTEAYVNVMPQYRPGGKVGDQVCPELNRPLARAEYLAALQAAADAGLRRLDSRRLP